MAETVELPSRLAILPFRNKVLLPGAIIRICCSSHSSVTLVEQELWQKEEKGLIGILPVRDDAEGSSIGTMINPGADSGERSLKFLVGTTYAQKSDAKDQQEVYWHSRGVAARALHLSRGVEKPGGRVTYVVVLEGPSRFNVQELGKRGPYSVARITSLEMTKALNSRGREDYSKGGGLVVKVTEGVPLVPARWFLLMRAIKEELGDNDDDEDDVAALERKMQAAGMPSMI